MRSVSVIIIFFLVSISFTGVKAQFLLAEDFSGYQSGSAVQNAAEPGNPDRGEWVSVGGALPAVINEQLSYADYLFSGRGNSLSFNPSANQVSENILCLSRTHMPYPCQPEGGFTDGSNEFYTAFMLNLSAANTEDVQEIFSCYQLSSGLRRGSIFYKLSSDKTKVAFSFQKNPEAPSSSWTQYYDKTPTFLLVVKYSHVCINEKNLGHSEFQLFVNPNPVKSEVENKVSMIGAYGNDTGYDTDLRQVTFRQSGKTTMKISGVRIANSFEKVLRGPDEPTETVFPQEPESIFYTVGKTLFRTKGMNGNLKVYDVGSCLVRDYDAHSGEPIKTNLEPGVYILLYKENGDEFIQKILIR